MKRRLEIARGLLHSPRVLFLDEPTVGLDPQTRASIWDYIHELREREAITIFLTTHYMDEAEHCDRIAIMDGGRIVALDTPAALKAAVGVDRVRIRTDDDAGAVPRCGTASGSTPWWTTATCASAWPTASGSCPACSPSSAWPSPPSTWPARRSTTCSSPTPGRTIRDAEASSGAAAAAVHGGPAMTEGTAAAPRRRRRPPRSRAARRRARHRGAARRAGATCAASRSCCTAS